ncbi:MAG: hypothetical protein CMP23_09265 [Rickettsiales bacterium]|nr:hypothetical protein [Rickettsiales bacterium]|tara:strand:+ start:4185 stop:5219 length:1035 start_codon:yes stop_codon:yes gene_type:complete
MHARLFWILAVSLPFALSACMGGSSTPARPDCDLDINNLSGTWVSLKGGGTGKDVPDPFARIKFSTEDGKGKAIYTAGQVAPGNPATNKYDYERTSVSEGGEALYSINMFPEKSKQRIERLKKDNRRLDVKFEGRLYVTIDQNRCALTLKDFYVTYVKGEETMDSNPTGIRTYLRATDELSFVHCDEVQQLYPFAMENPKWGERGDPPLDAKEGIFAKEPMWFHYAEKQFEGSRDEVLTKQQKAGVMAKEGCSYDYDLWVRDRRVEGKQKVAVTPKDKGFLHWRAQHSFEKSSAAGLFVEMHRYMTCAEGERTLIGNACTVVWPERERTAEEKAEAEAEANKKK